MIPNEQVIKVLEAYEYALADYLEVLKQIRKEYAEIHELLEEFLNATSG